jgi:copper chaperone CopZ
MKNIIMLVATMLLIGWSSNNVNAQNNTTDEFLVRVDGLGCPFCAYGLEKKFKELKGMEKPKIDMETGNFTFLFPTERKLTIEQVEKQVVAAGYTPVSVQITRADGTVESTKAPKTATKLTADLKTTTIQVAGNCDMCKSRIEKAAKSVDGVAKANWNKKTGQMTIAFDKTTSVSEIQKAVAASGHDTKAFKAKNDTYNALPGCCLYDRMQ